MRSVIIETLQTLENRSTVDIYTGSSPSESEWLLVTPSGRPLNSWSTRDDFKEHIESGGKFFKIRI